VAIQLGKNVRVIGDIASTYNGTSKGPPVQSFSDFHYLPNMSSLETDLANLRSLLNTYDTTYSNRLNVSDPTSAAAQAAAKTWLVRHQRNGYIDDYDCGAGAHQSGLEQDQSFVERHHSGQFVNPNTGQPYDSDLWNEIDDPMGAVNASTGLLANGSTPPWTGYGDGVINNNDGYAKVEGVVKMAITYSQWQRPPPRAGSNGATPRAAPRERRSAISSRGRLCPRIRRWRQCSSAPTSARIRR